MAARSGGGSPLETVEVETVPRSGIFLENWNWGCNKILGVPSLPIHSLDPLPLPSHSLRSRPPLIQLEGLGERCELPQLGLGQIPSRK